MQQEEGLEFSCTTMEYDREEKIALFSGNVVLEDKENELKERLGEAQTASDDDRVLEIMQEMLKVQKALKMVKVRLGREK